MQREGKEKEEVKSSGREEKGKERKGVHLISSHLISLRFQSNPIQLNPISTPILLLFIYPRKPRTSKDIQAIAVTVTITVTVKCLGNR